MNDKKRRQRLFSASLAALVLAVLVVGVALAAGNISTTDKWAWGTNVGWINFNPTNGGVTVYSDHLEGYAWGENVGWIRLGTCTGGSPCSHANTSNMNYGVNRSGNQLSGYAWGTNIGWINFSPTNGGVTVDPVTGWFDGYAWGENIGWIRFRSTGTPAYGVRTEVAIPDVGITIVKDAEPASATNFRFTGSVISSGGGGSGSSGDSGSSIADFYLDDASPDDGDAYGSSKRFTVRRGAVYSFAEPAVSGWHLASITCTPAGSATVNLATRSVTINTSSGLDVTCTFRNEQAAALTVRKYRESNGIAGQQAPETFLGAWTIQVKSSPTGTLVSQAATNSLGKVSFSLKPATYQVCEVIKSGWTQKVPNPAVNACHTLTLAPASATQVDFGNCLTSSCPTMVVPPVSSGETDAPIEPVTFAVAVDALDAWVEQWLATPDGPVEQTLEPDVSDDGEGTLRLFLPVVVK